MIIQTQSDEPVVVLKESEYFKLKHIEETMQARLLEEQTFIVALLTYMQSPEANIGEFIIPGYEIHTMVRDRILKYKYSKLPS